MNRLILFQKAKNDLKNTFIMTKSDGTPPILYKYRDWSNVFHKRILEDLKIYLPSTKSFNDPFEGSIPFEYDKMELTSEAIFQKMLSVAKEDPDHKHWSEEQIYKYVSEAYQSGWFLDDKHIEKHKAETKKQIETRFGILSLAKSDNTFLMWSHYASSHSGFCIGFDTKLLLESIPGIIDWVNYEKQIPTFGLFDSTADFAKKLLFTKSIVWEYENEVRIIKSGKAEKEISISPECIKEIIFGCKIEPQKQQDILDIATRQLPNCSFYNIELEINTFGLKKVPLYETL